jgi:glutamate mutase epsilon subunit
MIRNSFICKLINVQASMKENNEKKIKNCDEISKLIKAFPKDIAALDKRSVLAKVNSQGSGTTRKKIINKTSYFLSNSLNKSLNQK